jgi:ribosomal protein L37AE/L43A
MLTVEEQESMRQAAMNEVGTEPPCPFCGRPRVSRTSYIRCNPCGVNWSPAEGEDITKDPRLSRTKTTAHTRPESNDIAKTAGSSTSDVHSQVR